MKFKENVSVIDFITATRSCAGQVFFCTPEGDRLNLCSQLTQCLFGVIACQPEIMATGVLELECPQDRNILNQYLEQEV